MIQLSENARKILNARYLKKDDRGNVVETPEDMFRRVARHVAAAEKIYDWETRPENARSGSMRSCPRSSSCRTPPPS